MKLMKLADYGDIVIQCHNVPDADSIASGFALKVFLESHGASCRLIYAGRDMVTKSDLLLMLSLLKIPLEYVKELPRCNLLVTVDCQYGAGNIQKFDAENVAVFDHHRPEIHEGPYVFINPVLGSCSTLIWDMLNSEDFDFSSHKDVATALYYGLYIDTNNFSEMRHPKDRDLAGLSNVDWQIFNKFKYSSLSKDDLKIVANTLTSPKIVGKMGLLKADDCCDPNLLGFAGDIARSVKEFDCSVVYCLTHVGLKLSIRSSVREVMAKELAVFLTKDVGSGGGSIDKAGGYIDGAEIKKTFSSMSLEDYLVRRLEDYQNNFDHVYCAGHDLDFASMPQFCKMKIPVGFVPSTKVFRSGTPLTIRTLEGDIDIDASNDVYLMIGVAGEVYPIRKEKHERDYQVCDEPYNITDIEYSPTIINRLSGRKKSLLRFVQICVPRDEKVIRARELTKDTKVFSSWDQEKYFSGHPGDYIAASEPSTPGARYEDVYIIRRDLFERTYRQKT